MKKILSTGMALLLTLCMLLPAYSAFAADNSQVKNRLSAVMEQGDGAATYLYKDKTFGVTDAVDLMAAVRCNAATEEQIDGFTAAVEKALKDNNGKLYYPVPLYDSSNNQIGTSNVEELELYAAVICVYDAIGQDYTDVAGYDLSQQMQNCGTTAVNGTNYYLYRLVTEACALTDAPESFVQAVIQHLTDLYTMGSGPDFWGFGVSADDLGAFITALAPYADAYEAYIDDAVTLLEKDFSDEGYTSWGTANPDSTALALMAYSALGDQEKADKAYDLLCKFESDTTGVFNYNGEQNAYATKDALTALGYYADHLLNRIIIEPDEPTENPTQKQTTKKDETTTKTDKEETAKTESVKKSPATGNNAVFSGALALTAAGACLLLAKKRK